MTSCSSPAAPSTCEQGWPSAGVWALEWQGSLPLSGRTAAHALLPGSVIGFVQAGACLCDRPQEKPGAGSLELSRVLLGKHGSRWGFPADCCVPPLGHILAGGGGWSDSC